MKATEVLNRYAKGERDFRGANLRGQNFQGQDLSGADFSRADIRGTNFTNAILKEANFTEAKAGIQNHWLFCRFIALFWLSSIISNTSVVVGRGFVEYVVVSGGIPHYIIIPSILILLINANSVFIIAQQGFTTKTSSVICLIGFIAGLATIFTGSNEIRIILASTFVGILIFPLIVSKTTVFLFTLAGIAATVFASSGAIVLNMLFVFLLTRMDADAIAFKNFTNMEQATLIFIGWGALSVASLSLYIIWCIFIKTNNLPIATNDFPVVREAVFAFTTIGGTSFSSADLRDVSFAKASLAGSNFTSACLDYVDWESAQDLHLAQLSNSILSNPGVRDLLVTRSGHRKSFVDANLRAANLDGVNLEEADLTRADLSGATLRHANLKDANLAESVVLQTDFSEATMTGACLEAWNIDSNTILDDVDCRYVYLLRYQQERRPSSGDFAAGEFTKLFQEVLSTVDLIFRNGVDWRAFAEAFKEIQVENEGTLLAVQRIEDKGDGVFVVRVSVPPETDKEKIHSEFNQQYDLAVKALEAKYRAELQAKEDEIALYREQSANMWGVINSLANRPINVQAIAQSTSASKSMNNSSDSSQTVNIGGNVSGSTINLGTITGAVTNTINQLPDTPAADGLDLKQLLTELADAIATEPALPDTDKADLLEEVQNLAVAEQTEESAKKEGLARKAKKIFDATVNTLPDTAKLAEACSQLLPLILKALGFAV